MFRWDQEPKVTSGKQIKLEYCESTLDVTVWESGVFIIFSIFENIKDNSETAVRRCSSKKVFLKNS